MAKAVAEFKCNLVEGVLSHQVKRFVIDGNKVILNKTDVEHQVEEHKFELNEVYVIDIVVSTGEGKAKEGTTRTTVFKRAVETQYNLRSAHSRHVLSEINKKYVSLPFNLRGISGEESKTRYGMLELVNHDMVHAYPVLYEKDGTEATVTLSSRRNDFNPLSRWDCCSIQVHFTYIAKPNFEIEQLPTPIRLIWVHPW